MLDFQTAELVVGANATVTLASRPLRQGEGVDNSDTIILVEADDAGDGLSVDPVGFDPTAGNSAGGRHAFLALRLSDGASPGVTISSRVRRIVRVTFARVRKLADWAWSNLSCSLCKRVVKTLVVSGLTLLGIPVPEGGVIELALENLEGMVQSFADSEYSEIWEAIREVLNQAAELLDLWDGFLQAVCRVLGACGDE